MANRAIMSIGGSTGVPILLANGRFTGIASTLSPNGKPNVIGKISLRPILRPG